MLLYVLVEEQAALLYVAKTESWNGTSWFEVCDLNTGRMVLDHLELVIHQF